MKENEYAAMYAAEMEHWWYRSLREEVLHWIASALPTNGTAHNKRLLDLGCGTGGMLQRVQEKFPGFEAYGLDYYPQALAFASKRTPRGFLRGDVKALPFRKNTFDVVICLDVLYTREAYPGWENTLAEIHGLLREAGVIILQLPAFDFLRSQHDLNVHGVHRFTAGEVEQSLLRAGFRRCKIYYRYNLLFGAAVIARKLMAVKSEGSQVVTPQPVLNRMLYRYAQLENWMNRRVPVPFGLSVFAVAYR
jgi:SAM-dependent methyltransferase